jgi:glycerol-3-phosphate acyltransferase PlsY
VRSDRLPVELPRASCPERGAVPAVVVGRIRRSMDVPEASALAIAGAYLLGGIPFGLVLARVFAGVDIRKVGSGNVGATNASRAFRKPWSMVVFVLVYLLDFAKGYLPTAFLTDAMLGAEAAVGLRVLVGTAAVVGHCFSPFLGMRGGKGVATTTGVLAALDPAALLIGLVVFGAVFSTARVVALGSLALGVTLPVAVILRDPASAFAARWPVSVFALSIAAFLFYTHRDNIRRLLAAKE